MRKILRECDTPFYIDLIYKGKSISDLSTNPYDFFLGGILSSLAQVMLAYKSDLRCYYGLGYAEQVSEMGGLEQLLLTFIFFK
jgi:hypothetical protein